MNREQIIEAANRTFSRFDKDSSGYFDQNEIYGLIQETHRIMGNATPPTEDQVRGYFSLFDSNKDGQISREEYVSKVVDIFERHIGPIPTYTYREPAPTHPSIVSSGQSQWQSSAQSRTTPSFPSAGGYSTTPSQNFGVSAQGTQPQFRQTLPVQTGAQIPNYSQGGARVVSSAAPGMQYTQPSPHSQTVMNPSILPNQPQFTDQTASNKTTSSLQSGTSRQTSFDSTTMVNSVPFGSQSRRQLRFMQLSLMYNFLHFIVEKKNL
eukprot:TRINITY_DN31042_c0_g1_i1.p1 TRINITY_DN31042_c0_g1~~TRINITY_DN31042_c0_g1_i1.p1  ORF type:complete len:265 (-),score=23.36 TRINITY_DN31042_c0_g1_i1:51-845(-)